MELIRSQREAIERLLDKARKSIDSEQKDTVYFKAPTGSGKTFMMINFIDELIEWSKSNIEHKLIFVVTTLSSAELPKQLEENFNEYKHYIQNKNLKVERIESPSNAKTSSKIEKNYEFFAEPNKVFIIGGASFRKNTILREQGSIEALLGEIKLNNYKLVYIRDEAHIGADTKKSKKEEVTFEENMQNNAHFIIKMTATPSSNHDLIELTEKDLKTDDVKLLKLHKKYNEGLEKESFLLDNEKILKEACLKFKEIKKAYNDHISEPDLVGINAAMLIQVDNNSASNPEKQKEFEENLELIIKTLDEHNLKWVKYFDQNDKSSNQRLKENYSLRDISKNNSAIDVIIFKIGPATGWNIPRACMLVQLRNVSSNNLSIQTIGIIKRNPVPKASLKENSIARNYYIYSNLDREENKQKVLVLKDHFKEEKFAIGKLENLNSKTIFNSEKYENKALDLINSFDAENFLTNCKMLQEEFKEKGFIVAEKKRYGSNEIISWKILNKIEMEIFNHRELLKNKKYLTSKINDKLKVFYDASLKDKINTTVFWYLFIKDKLSFLVNEYNSEIEKQIDKNEINFILKEEKILPENYFDSESDKPVIVSEKYAYKEINSEDTNLNPESSAEKDFVKTLNNIIIYNSETKANLKVWTKNPTHSGINFEYFNNEFEIANSYPDFLIKYKDHYLYFEVKKYKNDIDKEKTLSLFKTYKEYINKNKESKIKLSLIIALVNRENEIYFAGASTIDSLNAKLENRNIESEEVHEQIRSQDVNLNLISILNS
ncbi:DEAD/DEAH box helicase family protein [Mesomycoplasma molare]|uniref:DEAD/DEAH box helicase family protein n=1 Tax=Mesomycoplasma molare TaxID=171288 RepID=A0ABY5TXB6_9BACT|nr:DEAD/DEAH box helicase family protein [Mesomycoplasma molare]UWD34226.1 DEAD/DEAH box helicase family protein [Mesomycoplasma molare]